MKKNGFTLVELLAVLIVLAILALISVPVIVSIVSQSRAGAIKDSAHGVLEAANLYYTKYAGQEIELDLSNQDDIAKLDFKGTLPDGGKLIITASGKMAIKMYNAKYCAYKLISDEEITTVESDCSEINIDPIEIEGKYINISDGSADIIKDLKIYGNTVDSKKLGSTGTISLVITGKNLIKGNGFSSKANDTNYWYSSLNTTMFTPLQEGWIKVNCQNTDASVTKWCGFLTKTTNVVPLEKNKDYTYYYESRNNKSVIKDNSSSIYLNLDCTTCIPGVAYTNNVELKSTSNYAAAKKILNTKTKSTYDKVDLGIRGFVGARNLETVNIEFRAMLVYGKQTLDTIGDYEPYKEQIYNVELKTLLNKPIKGIGLNEILEKKDGYWGITSGSIFTQFHSDTQKILNNIELYKDVNNIYIDDLVSPTNIKLKYYN